MAPSARPSAGQMKVGEPAWNGSAVAKTASA